MSPTEGIGDSCSLCGHAVESVTANPILKFLIGKNFECMGKVMGKVMSVDNQGTSEVSIAVYTPDNIVLRYRIF